MEDFDPNKSHGKALEKLIWAMDEKRRELLKMFTEGDFGWDDGRNGWCLDEPVKHNIQPKMIGPTLAGFRSKVANLKEMKSSYLKILEQMTDTEVREFDRQTRYSSEIFEGTLKAIEGSAMAIAVLEEEKH